MNTPLTTHTQSLDTPLGTCIISAHAGGISSVSFIDDERASEPPSNTPPAPNERTTPDDVAAKQHLKALLSELKGYFSGGFTHFSCTFAPITGTPFQKSVWNALLNIPFGQTVTYAQLAQQLGRDARSARAVGAAAGQNPAAILCPCHRVIGASGDLTGFRWGTQRKAQLLQLEGALHQTPLFSLTS